MIVCKRCKEEECEYGICNDCRQIIYQERREKEQNKVQSKIKATKEYGIKRVKAEAFAPYWCTEHRNCFRATITEDGKGESEEHVNKKFERWKYHRMRRHIVFCELVLKDGSRPDLVIVENGENIYIEEILCSEKEENIVSKMQKYPFPIRKIYVGDKNGT